MTRWGIWARWVVAWSSCGVIAALTGCSAGTDAAPAPAQARPAAATASPGGGAGAATTTAGPAGSGGSGGSTAVSGSVAPLTGLRVTAAVAQRPAVAVVVAGSDPVGLGSADLVFAELAGPVRYLAVFQSGEAGAVGPVTSIRPTDGQALSVLHPLTGYEGGTTAFVAVLDATKVIDEGYAGHRSWYSGGPGRVTVSTAALAAAGRSDGPPPAVFGYRLPGDSLASAGQTHPTSVRVAAPGEPAEQWNFDAGTGRWVQTAGGPRVSVANLVVQIVSFKTVYLSRKYGQTVPSARVIGRGAVTVLSGAAPGGTGGTAAAGSWAKPGITAVTNYFDAAGQPMSFEPGPTWVVLAPAGTRTSQAGG
jgi:Protein of unknown function (DUF3048) C-terminal domain/Protein of unknown function (DUF3048) N-terminal domain